MRLVEILFLFLLSLDLLRQVRNSSTLIVVHTIIHYAPEVRCALLIGMIVCASAHLGGGQGLFRLKSQLELLLESASN